MEKEADIQVLEEGLVLCRGFLSTEQHIDLLKMMKDFELKDSNGEWNYPDNFGNKKGRCFSSLCEVSQVIQDVAVEAKRLIENFSPIFTYEAFTHLLINAYPSSNGMAWHKDDIGRHDGDKDAPVYSLSLGNDALFYYRVTPKSPTKEILLYGGDLLVFTKPLRLMNHCVKTVYMNSFNSKGYREDYSCNERYNLTFRTCTGLSDEDYKNAQTTQYNLKRKEQFKKSRKERKKDYESSIEQFSK